MKKPLCQKPLCHLLIIASLAAAPAAFAAGGDEPKEAAAPADPVIAAAQAAIRAGDWNSAREGLQKALARDPGQADYHNLYAYSIRKGPNPGMDLVFRHYSEALRIEPKHRGAHEYIGEAYLMVGNLAKAKEHLSQLDRICFLPCDEYRMLKSAVIEHEAKHKR